TQTMSTKGRSEILDTKKNRIIRAVSCVYDMDVNTILLNENRKRKFVEPRQMLMMFLKEKTSMSFPEIGGLFKRKFNHATVIHGVRTIKNDIETNHDTREKFDEITHLLTNEKSISDFEKNKSTKVDLKNETTADAKPVLAVRSLSIGNYLKRDGVI